MSITPHYKCTNIHNIYTTFQIQFHQKAVDFERHEYSGGTASSSRCQLPSYSLYMGAVCPSSVTIDGYLAHNAFKTTISYC